MTHPIYPPLALGALLALAAVGAQATSYAADSMFAYFDEVAGPAPTGPDATKDSVTKVSRPGHADFTPRP